MNDYLNGHGPEWYAAFVISESDSIAAVYDRNPNGAVTTCGDWTVTRLVQHVGSVQRWATHVVEHGGEPDDKSTLKAPDGADLGEWLIEGATAAASQLQRVDADDELWNPWPVPQIAGVWPRRMAQETAMHRYDADLTIGAVQPIDATLASDGIDEYLRWAVPRAVAEGTELPYGSLHIHCTDVEGEWLVRNDADGYRVSREHAKGDAALRGTASNLLLRLWGRPVDDEWLETVGDDAVGDAWLAIGGR